MAKNYDAVTLNFYKSSHLLSLIIALKIKKLFFYYSFLLFILVIYIIKKAYFLWVKSYKKD